jgi:hypothetical protein
MIAAYYPNWDARCAFAIRGGAADVYRARRDQGDELMLVHGQARFLTVVAMEAAAAPIWILRIDSLERRIWLPLKLRPRKAGAGLRALACTG